MSVQFYFDENVHGDIIRGLRARSVDVLTVQEDGHDHTPDSIVLDRALALGRVIVSSDADFLAITVARMRAEVHFGGLVYFHQNRLTIGECITDLETIAICSDPTEWEDRVEFLPL